MHKERILIIEDDEALREVIKLALENNGFTNIVTAEDGEIGLKKARELLPALIFLDLMLPGIAGLNVCKQLKNSEETEHIPIIMLSAKSEDYDKITGLNVGADDYMTKPFNPLELIARVKSQLRRYTSLGAMEGKSDSVFTTGGLVVDDERKTVTVDGEEVVLTPTEYGILKMLVREPGKVFSIEQIYEEVWNEPSYNSENTVAVHIRRIREKIEINPKNPRYLKVVWGIGYKIEKI